MSDVLKKNLRTYFEEKICLTKYIYIAITDLADYGLLSIHKSFVVNTG